MRCLARFLLSILVLAAPLAVTAQQEKLPPDALALVEKQWPQAKKTSTGLRYVMIKEGEGDLVRPGDLISVLYVGRLLSGEVFDQQSARPFSFRVGRGLVIPGWDQGMQLLKPGGKMVLIVPPDLAYGVRGDPPHIPHNATLIFEIELVSVERAPPPAAPPPAKKSK